MNIEVSAMAAPLAAGDLLDREFLEIRARLLQVAAALDRLDRAAGDVSHDKRRIDLDRAIQVLGQSGSGRAETLQLVFSLPYDQGWKSTFGLTNGRTAHTE
jgi:hypothetical protein